MYPLPSLLKIKNDGKGESFGFRVDELSLIIFHFPTK